MTRLRDVPRYFFDTDDGDQRSEDEQGLEFADDEAARREAIAALPEMARDKLPNGDHRDFSVRVRDEAGNVIYTACLALNGEWHVSRRS